MLIGVDGEIRIYMGTPEEWIVDDFTCEFCYHRQVHIYSTEDEFELVCSSCGEHVAYIKGSYE